jgi:hypothetical protein
MDPSTAQNNAGVSSEIPLNSDPRQPETVPELAFMDTARPGPPSPVESDDDLTRASAKDAVSDTEKAAVASAPVDASVPVDTKPAKRNWNIFEAKDPNSWYYKLSHSTAFGLFVITFAIAADTLVYR